MLSFEELLIDQVKRNETIYNTRSKEHKNTGKRDVIWKKISKELGVHVEDCKQRWRSLRDRFVRELKKVHSGLIEYDSDLWLHYNDLLFLKEYVQPRSFKNNSYQETSINNVTIESDYRGNDTAEVITDEFMLDIGETEIKRENGTISPEPEYLESEVSVVDDGPPAKKSRPNGTADVFTDFMGNMSKLMDNQLNGQGPSDEETENTLFMKMIVKKMDLLPLQSQGTLQIEMLTLVNNELRKYLQ